MYPGEKESFVFGGIASKLWFWRVFAKLTKSDSYLKLCVFERLITIRSVNQTQNVLWGEKEIDSRKNREQNWVGFGQSLPGRQIAIVTQNCCIFQWFETIRSSVNQARNVSYGERQIDSRRNREQNWVDFVQFSLESCCVFEMLRAIISSIDQTQHVF